MKTGADPEICEEGGAATPCPFPSPFLPLPLPLPLSLPLSLQCLYSSSSGVDGAAAGSSGRRR